MEFSSVICGNRGIEGRISSIKDDRETNIPFLGIYLGMQLAKIEYCRNVLNFKDFYDISLKKYDFPIIAFNI